MGPKDFSLFIGVRNLNYIYIEVIEKNVSSSNVLKKWKYNGKRTNQKEKVNKIEDYVGLTRHKSKQD